MYNFYQYERAAKRLGSGPLDVSMENPVTSPKSPTSKKKRAKSQAGGYEKQKYASVQLSTATAQPSVAVKNARTNLNSYERREKLV